MKKIISLSAGIFFLLLVSCNNTPSATESTTTQQEPEQKTVGQSGVKDDVSQKNVVQIAIGSKDHTTLVAAVKAADLVDVLSNTGPFTVFAPTNAAFDKLPAGTVDGLLKPEKKEALTDILQYHVSVGVFKEAAIFFGNGDVVSIYLSDNLSISHGSFFKYTNRNMVL